MSNIRKLLVFHRKVFAVVQGLGPMDIPTLHPEERAKLCDKKQIDVADSTEAARRWVDSERRRLLVRPIMNMAKKIAARAWRLGRRKPSPTTPKLNPHPQVSSDGKVRAR